MLNTSYILRACEPATKRESRRIGFDDTRENVECFGELASAVWHVRQVVQEIRCQRVTYVSYCALPCM